MAWITQNQNERRLFFRTYAKLSQQGVLPQAVRLVRQGNTTRLGRFCVSPILFTDSGRVRRGRLQLFFVVRF